MSRDTEREKKHVTKFLRSNAVAVHSDRCKETMRRAHVAIFTSRGNGSKSDEIQSNLQRNQVRYDGNTRASTLRREVGLGGLVRCNFGQQERCSSSFRKIEEKTRLSSSEETQAPADAEQEIYVKRPQLAEFLRFLLTNLTRWYSVLKVTW